MQRGGGIDGYNQLPQGGSVRTLAAALVTSAPGLSLPLPTSAPGLRSPLPHLHRDCARRCHICTATALAVATSAPRLRSLLPQLHRDRALPSPIASALAGHFGGPLY